MKCQILLSWKNKKNISKYRLLKFLPSMQCVKGKQYMVINICVVFAPKYDVGSY